MKKTILITTLFLLLFGASIGQSKITRKAAPISEEFIKNCFAHTINYETGTALPDEYAADFTITASFNVDTSGRIINLKFDNSKFPLAIESITKKIMNTNNNWFPAIKDCELVVSDKIIFTFIKKSTKEQQGLAKNGDREWAKTAYYYYEPGLSATTLWGNNNIYTFNVAFRQP
jgi:hypothetical protein